MIPSIANAQSEQSVPIPFDESDPWAMLTLSLIKDRYVAIEHPFITSSRDGYTWLIIPKTIKKVLPNADTLTTEAQSSVRISNGAGASNG